MAWLREAAPDATSTSSAACAAAPRPAATSTSWPPTPRPRCSATSPATAQVERVLGLGDTKASILLAGRCRPTSAGAGRVARRGAAVLHRIEGAQHRAARPRAVARLHAERVRPRRRRHRRPHRRRDRGRHLRRAGPAVHRPGAARGPRRDRRRRGRARCRGWSTLADLQGDVHMHTTASDGRDDIETMAIAARDAGLEYIAITDHSQSLAMANGLDDARALAHAARIRALERRIDGITHPRRHRDATSSPTAAGPGGRRSPRSTSSIASVHSAFDQSAEAMTVRVLTAMACPSSTPSATRPAARCCAVTAPDRHRGGDRGGRRATASRSRSTASSTASTCPTCTRGAPRAGRRADDRQRRALDHRARPAALGRADGAPGAGWNPPTSEHARRRRVPATGCAASRPRRRRRDGRGDRRRDPGRRRPSTSRRRRRPSRTPSTRPSIC